MKKRTILLVVICTIVAEFSCVVASRMRRSAENCGVAKIIPGLIIRGQSFPRGTFPWIVALINIGLYPAEYFCGGTLISSTLVISAAHCIREKQRTGMTSPREVLAVFGAHKLDSTEERLNGRYQLSPKNIYIHPDYNQSSLNFDADVSLLEFEKESISFNNFVQPICLWNLKIESVVTGVVAGWGKSEDPFKSFEIEPKVIKPQIKTNENCFLETKALVDLSSNRTFCAGLKDKSGVCRGDSGGGLFTLIDGVFYLKGIVSASLVIGTECDISRNAIYGNVIKFKDWIEVKTGEVLVATKEVPCTFTMSYSRFYPSEIRTCEVNKTIDSNDYVLGSMVNRTMEGFVMKDNNETEFLPRNISEKFPNLKQLIAQKCGLRVIHDFYFKGMRKLVLLYLNDNKITTIESESFKDLINVQYLYLDKNMIGTLDGKLFDSMIDLNELYLNDNKIKFLSPTTLNISNQNHLFMVSVFTDSSSNLTLLELKICELTTIHDFYFKDLRKLEYLNLRNNQIKIIEGNSFKDLIKVRDLNLGYNRIELLHEKLFSSMFGLLNLHLNNNKIKLLSPTTFNIPSRSLSFINLKENVCIDYRYAGWYRLLSKLEADLKAQCVE